MSTEPHSVRFQTVGCRLNQYETERMAASLSGFGLRRAAAGEAADLYIINTCTVTHRADKDCRYLVRKARRENPRARVVLVGCYVETDPERIAREEGADLVILNREKETIAGILPRHWPELFRDGGGGEGELVDFYQRNRAWIKISDGCNQSCSYCLVTKVRGDLVCRAAGDIVNEIDSLVSHGYNEVVLTGVNIGYYADKSCTPPLDSFTDLCRHIMERTGLRRLRLSSIEPQSVTEDLMSLYAAAAGRICRYWHLPLQSGSDRILRLMRRPYTAAEYLDRVADVKDRLPGGIVGADIIVGFPGETDVDFAASCRVADSGLIDYLHVFSYSDRPGTAAASFPEKISPELIRERVRQLKQISAGRWRQAHHKHIGRTLEVISENRKAEDGRFRAVADNYLRVRLPEGADYGKRIVLVRPTVAFDKFADCDVID